MKYGTLTTFVQIGSELYLLCQIFEAKVNKYYIVRVSVLKYLSLRVFPFEMLQFYDAYTKSIQLSFMWVLFEPFINTVFTDTF